MTIKRFRLSAQAVADLEQIADHLGDRYPSAADRVIDELFRTFESLTVFPEMGESLHDLRPGLRMLIPAKPAASYAVFYYVREDSILVADIIHSAPDWVGMFFMGDR
jgi:plasmid stabilization system protein ParE